MFLTLNLIKGQCTLIIDKALTSYNTKLVLPNANYGILRQREKNTNSALIAF